MDDLRQVARPGQQETRAGQYIEPMQLQVVCYQLWENIKGRPPGPITAADLQEVGNWTGRCTSSMRRHWPPPSPIRGYRSSERQLRTWFDKELITGRHARPGAAR